MVHADSSAFSPGSSKREVYAQVLEQATLLFDGQRNWASLVNRNPFHFPSRYPPTPPDPNYRLLTPLSNFSNTAALLWHAFHSLPAPSYHVNWAGFYFTNPSNASELILGPFQGQVACQSIAFGRGVCGTAARDATTQLVRDVERFPGHIACDGTSRSEIVVPVVKEDKVVAIIDVDCAELDGFTEEDQRALEELAALLARSCDF